MRAVYRSLHRKIAGEDAVDKHAHQIREPDVEHEFVGGILEVLADGQQARNVEELKRRDVER